MRQSRKSSPYLEEARLSDVMAAIQAMGNHRYYKLCCEGWSDRITGQTENSEYWRQIFLQHPEFFRFDSNKQRVSLIWRRQFPKRYDPKKDRKLSDEDYRSISDDEKKKLSRLPLSSENTLTLMNIAIQLHEKALENQREKRWWFQHATEIFSTLGALLGSAIGALVALKIAGIV